MPEARVIFGERVRRGAIRMVMLLMLSLWWAFGVGDAGARPAALPFTLQTPTAGMETPAATPSPMASPTSQLSTQTATPIATPTPAVDFRLVSWRLWPKDLNGGCEQGMHNIFIVTRDASGQPLSNIVVGDTYNNVEEVTGRPGKEPGKVDIPLYANTMEIIVKRDAVTGQPYSSEASPPCASFITTIPDEQLVQAGYFANELEAQWNREHYGYICGGHFSWEVIFQRTW
ncbi:MAG: hypothetical protein ACP5R2_12135 [Anaerolineae bacterium]